MNASFTRLRLCTKTGRKISGFAKPVTLLRTKTYKNGGFQKRSSKWIFTKTEVFENALDQCENTKTDENKNAAVATIQITHSMAPLQSDLIKTHQCELKPQKRIFLLKFSDQRERTKTGIFISVFVQKRSSVKVLTGQKMLKSSRAPIAAELLRMTSK